MRIISCIYGTILRFCNDLSGQPGEKAMKPFLLIALYLLLYSTEGLSQKKYPASEELRKNSTYLTVGIYPEGIYSNITANYERLIREFPESFFHAIQARVGAGPWVAWLAEGINFFSVASLCMGRSGSHIETGIGLLFTYHTNSSEWHPIVNDRHIAGNIGYRFQRPEGRFLLRAGLGWPEGFYVSLGYCF